MNASFANTPYVTARDESYDVAYTALRARYAGHGTAGAAQATVAEQQAREARSMRDYPEAYRCGQIMEHDRYNYYRTGVSGDMAVMTVDDLKRLFYDETGRRTDVGALRAMAERRRTEGKDSDVPTAVRPAAAYRVLEYKTDVSDDGAEFTSRRELVLRGEDRISAQVEKGNESGLSARMHALAEKAKKWIPEEKVGKLTGVRNISSPVAGIALVVVFAMLLCLPVILNVLINQTDSELYALEDQIRALEAEEAELRVQLEAKNDLRFIEDEAINRYGMIRLEQSTFRYLRLRGDEVIETYTPERRGNNAAVLALLSALGIRRGDE